MHLYPLPKRSTETFWKNAIQFRYWLLGRQSNEIKTVRTDIIECPNSPVGASTVDRWFINNAREMKEIGVSRVKMAVRIEQGDDSYRMQPIWHFLAKQGGKYENYISEIAAEFSLDLDLIREKALKK
jgi:spore cortex formation protein SpoVR/YcgB (stage V sporulation)